MQGSEVNNKIHRVSTKEILYDVMVELCELFHMPDVVFTNKCIGGVLWGYHETPFSLTVDDDDIILYTIDKTGDAFGFDSPKQAARWIAERM